MATREVSDQQFFCRYYVSVANKQTVELGGAEVEEVRTKELGGAEVEEVRTVELGGGEVEELRTEELGGDEVEEDQTVELGGESSGEDTSPFESEQGQCDNTLWITSNVQARALKFLRKESISS